MGDWILQGGNTIGLSIGKVTVAATINSTDNNPLVFIP